MQNSANPERSPDAIERETRHTQAAPATTQTPNLNRSSRFIINVEEEETKLEFDAAQKLVTPPAINEEEEKEQEDLRMSSDTDADQSKIVLMVQTIPQSVDHSMQSGPIMYSNDISD